MSTIGLRKSFGGVHALNGVDLEVQRDSLHCIIGPNGSGKTTLLNAVSGVLTPTAGRIHFRGHDITTTPSEDIAALGIRRTFQAGKLAQNLTALENVMCGMHHGSGALTRSLLRRPFASSEAEVHMREEGLAYLELVGLRDRANWWSSELNWVERQLVQIARALAPQPDLLLLDEPTGGMGSDESRRVADLIQAVRSARPVTIALVTHDVALVVNLADRLTCLSFGTVIASGPPKVVLDDPGVREAYLGI